MWPFNNGSKNILEPEDALRIKQEHESFIKPYNDLLIELFADRGMLLGSARYGDMTGVERYDALSEIDLRIIKVKDLIQKEENRCHQLLN